MLHGDHLIQRPRRVQAKLTRRRHGLRPRPIRVGQWLEVGGQLARQRVRDGGGAIGGVDRRVADTFRAGGLAATTILPR